MEMKILDFSEGKKGRSVRPWGIRGKLVQPSTPFVAYITFSWDEGYLVDSRNPNRALNPSL